MTEIENRLTSDIRANPSSMIDMVRNEYMTREEAFCCVAAILYGPKLKGVIKAENFKQFWEAQLSSVPYKNGLLSASAPEHKDAAVEQIGREKADIYEHSKLVVQRVRERIPELWNLLKDSDVFWVSAVRLDVAALDDYEGPADHRGYNQRDPSDDSYLRPLNGQLTWRGADPSLLKRVLDM